MVIYSIERKLVSTVISLALLTSVFFVANVPAVNMFDGTYNYRYNVKINYVWQTYNIPSGLTIDNSYIFSSRDTSVAGQVDSSGNVYFSAPCPYGDQEAIFTGSIKFDGTGQGRYSCQYNHVGGWSVARLSSSSDGSGSSSDNFVDQVFDSFSSVGSILGVSDDLFINGFIGMMILFLPSTIILALGMRRTRQRRLQQLQANQAKGNTSNLNLQSQQKREYQALPPQSAQQGRAEKLAPQICIDSPSHLMEAQGEVTVDSHFPTSLNLRANWTKGSVDLFWDQPEITNNEYQLDHYQISAMQYGSTSTAPVRIPVAQLQPGNTHWSEAFRQTYRYNTRGDREGYIVEAILRHSTSTGQSEVLRIGGMVYAPYPPTL